MATKIKVVMWYGGKLERLTRYVYRVIIIDEDECRIFIHPTNASALKGKIVG